MLLSAPHHVKACTHVIARHAEQRSTGWAAAERVEQVSHFWVWECCEAQRLLPLADPVRTILQI